MKRLLFGFMALCLSMMPLAAWSQEAYAVLSVDYGNECYFNDEPYGYASTLVFYYDDQKEYRMLNSEDCYVFSLNDIGETPAWTALTEYSSDDWSYNPCVYEVVFDPSFEDARPISTHGWFSGFVCLYNIEGFEYLNTSEVRDMGQMFSYCSSLYNLEIGHFDTSKVTNMEGMFEECWELSSLDLSNFNTANVTNMKSMFYDCWGLSSLDLSNFNTRNVTDMSYMFMGCGGLNSLKLTNFNTRNVTDMSYMFGYCYSCTNLNVKGFDTINVTNMADMFCYCSSLTSLDLNSFNTSKVTNMSGLFSGCYKLNDLKYSNFNTMNVTDMHYMFNECSSLTTIQLSHLNTANVKSFLGMFTKCTSLTEIDLNSFNTAKGTDFSYMFSNCSNLKNINVAHFNTANATNFSSMFSGCSGLTEIDLSSFNTAKGTSFASMFSNCNNLRNINVTHFSTANATTLANMFAGCSGLTTIDLSSFNTEKVTSMGGMFKGCSRLTGLSLSGFKTPKVTYVSSMFEGCGRLLSLDLSNFNLSLQYSGSSSKMLYGCISLASLALPNVMSALADDACTGVGSAFKPCLLAVPEEFDFGINDTSGCFEWKSGYFSLQAYTDLNNYNDVIFVDNASLAKGSQGVLSVKMNNTTAVRGFQFDLVLPNGVSVAEGADGKLMVKLSSARVNTDNFDMFTCSRQADGSIRVFCLSALEPTTFSGNSGEVCRVFVNVDEDMANGDYFVKLKNVVYTDDAANKYTIEGEVVSKLTVNDVAMGDANGDGSIDVADVAVLANYILGRNAGDVVPSAMDVNGDGSIDVADLASICNIILHGTASAPARRAKNADTSSTVQMGVRPICLCAGETAEIELTLDNPMDDVCSWQTDLILPDGLHVEGVRLSDKRKVDQVVEWETQNDGALRVLSFSMSNKLLLENEGTVAFVKVKVDDNMPAGVYGLGLNGSILTNGHNRIMAADGSATITVNGATGIGDLTNQKENVVDQYGVGGARIGTAQRGINIIKMADGTVRKVTRR